MQLLIGSDQLPTPPEVLLHIAQYKVLHAAEDCQPGSMACPTFVLKLPNAAPVLVGFNFDTHCVRLAQTPALDAQSPDEERRTKMPRFELKLAAVDDVDSLNDCFWIFNNNIILVHHSAPKGLTTTGFQPVGFFGLYTASSGSIMFRQDTVANDQLNSEYGEDIRNMLIRNVVYKSAEAAGIDVHSILIKHAFMWLHPKRAAQVLLVTESHEMIWASLDGGTSVKEASRPHGFFEPMADGVTWSVTFHFKAELDKMMTTTLRHMAQGPPEHDLSFHCTVAGAHKCIKWNDVQLADTWGQVSDWAACAVKFK